MTHAFSDLLNEPAAQPPADGQVPARNRDCARCTMLAEKARRAGTPIPPVSQCESWVRDAVRYWGGLCADCADWEYSLRWNLRYAAARDDDKKRDLDRERQARSARGRRFFGTAGKP